MSSTVPKKDSLHFLSDYYFDIKSPVAFTGPLALYKEAKKTGNFHGDQDYSKSSISISVTRLC